MKKLVIPEGFSVVLKCGPYERIISKKLYYDMVNLELKDGYLTQLYQKKYGEKTVVDGDTVIKTEVSYSWHTKNVCVAKRKYKDEKYIEFIDGNDFLMEELFTEDEIFSECHIALFKTVGESIVITKYLIKDTGDEIRVDVVDEFCLVFEDGNLIMKHHGDPVTLEFAKEFFSDIYHCGVQLSTYMKNFIFNSFSDTPGFNDIYLDYKAVISESFNESDMYKKFCYYYYMGQKDFYLLAEFYIKNEMRNQVTKLNPVYTGQPIPQIKSIRVSKIAFDILKSHSGDNHCREILTRIENHPKIGPDGLAVMHNALELMSKAKLIHDNYLASLSIRNLECLITIFDTFDITPKTLMDRAIRAYFYYNKLPEHFFREIVDYINMCKQLEIEVPKKLPKDVIREHNLLVPKIKQITLQHNEEGFKQKVLQNNELLKYLPTSPKYTIISPETPKDLIKEGAALSHCVGSYIEAYVSGRSKIFFVRLKQAVNVPYVTIELNHFNQLVQASGKFNRRADAAVLGFVRKWIKNISGKEEKIAC